MTDLVAFYAALPRATLQKLETSEQLGDRAKQAIRLALGKVPVPGEKDRPRKLEQTVRRECNGWLEARGAFVLKLEQGFRPEKCRKCGAHLGRGAKSSMVTLGTPDAIAFWPDGGAWVIEYKRSHGGKMSEDQLIVRTAVRASGVIHVVARGIEDLEAVARETRAEP
ncbi:MAG: hypothetical protein ACREL7_06000 [Longimicrobiales bacterium]